MSSATSGCSTCGASTRFPSARFTSSPPSDFALLFLAWFPRLGRTHAELRPPAAAAWIRRSLATSLRSRHPYSVNLLLGGYDVPASAPALYWIDYLGTLATVPYAAHGYGAFFALSCLDAHWEENMDRERGIEVLKMCLTEVRKRASPLPPAPFPLSLPVCGPLNTSLPPFASGRPRRRPGRPQRPTRRQGWRPGHRPRQVLSDSFLSA
jgi:hypothetical protein